MLTLDFLHPGLMLFVRAFVCFGSTLLLYNDLYFPTGWAGETMSVLGRARFGFLLSAPDLSHFDLSMLLRSVAQLSLIPLALDFLHLGFSCFHEVSRDMVQFCRYQVGQELVSPHH